MLELWVVQLSRTADSGEPINGNWRGHKWVNGETLCLSKRDAKKLRGRVGGYMMPLEESNLIHRLSEKLVAAIEEVNNLSMADFADPLVEKQLKFAESTLEETDEEEELDDDLFELAVVDDK